MLFVTIGTMPSPMRTLLAAIKDIAVTTADEIVFQGMIPEGEKLSFLAVVKMDREQFYGYLQAAEIVVCHAGIGTIHDCITANKKTIVVPRLSSRAEHSNDHQLEICNELKKRELPNLMIVSEPIDVADAIQELRRRSLPLCPPDDPLPPLRHAILSDLKDWAHPLR